MIQIWKFKEVLLIIPLLLVLSCTKNEKNTEISKIDKRSGMQFPNYKERNSGLGRVINKKDTLKILLEFSECGEWGGHRESIFLQRNLQNKIFARFIKDSVSCENIKNFKDYSALDDKTRVITRDTIKILTAKDEELINIFLHRLFEIYLNQENLYTPEDYESYAYTDAGTSLQIINSDLSLNLNFWNIDESANTWYGIVRKQIFGDILKNKQ